MKRENIMKKIILFFLFIIPLLILLSCEKPPELEPGRLTVKYLHGNRIHLGETIKFYYLPKKNMPEAFLMSITFPDHSSKHICLDFKISKGIAEGFFKIPDMVRSVRIFPIGDTKRPEPTTILVHDKNGIPVPGARAEFANSMFIGSIVMSDSFFWADLNDNPHLVGFFRTRWFRRSFDEEGRKIIKREVDSLSRHAEQNPDIYGVLASGYAMLAELDLSKKMLEKYMSFGEMDEEIASSAANDLYTYSSLSGKEDKEEEKIFIEIARQFPMSYVAEEYIEKVIYSGKRKGVADSLAVKILESRVERDLSAHFYFSEYFMGIGDTASALEHAKKYTQALQSGKIPRCDYWSVPRQAPEMFMRLANDEFEKNNFKRAKEHAKNAIEYEKESIKIGSAHVFISRCCIALGDTKYAKENLLNSIAYGAFAEAKELIGEVYPNVEPEKALKIIFSEAKSHAKKAPDFEIITFAGDTIRPGSQIICIDFWNPGCKPCIAEMPLLSRFAGNHATENILWLSVSNAPARHFEENSYPLKNWTLCPENNKAFNSFEVTAIPQFILVDRDGKIRYSQVGAPLDTASVRILLGLLDFESKMSEGL